MSYDLYYVANEARQFDSAKASTYLAKLPHCTVHPRAGDGFQAIYEHPDTGVYWSCEYSPPSTDFESPLDPEQALLAGVVDTGLSFNLNYMRPRYFGLESIPYAAAIARDLNLRVYDPQDDDCTVAEADAVKLTASWIKGNEWASRGRPDSLYLDPDLAMEMWRYNTQLAEGWSALEALGIAAVIPKIFPSAMRGSNRVVRTVVWGGDYRIAFPPCDAVLIAVAEKPSLITRAIGKKGPAADFASWVDVERVLAPTLEKMTLCGLDYQLQTEASGANFKRLTASTRSKRIDPRDFNPNVSQHMFVDVPMSTGVE